MGNKNDHEPNIQTQKKKRFALKNLPVMTSDEEIPNIDPISTNHSKTSEKEKKIYDPISNDRNQRDQTINQKQKKNLSSSTLGFTNFYSKNLKRTLSTKSDDHQDYFGIIVNFRIFRMNEIGDVIELLKNLPIDPRYIVSKIKAQIQSLIGIENKRYHLIYDDKAENQNPNKIEDPNCIPNSMSLESFGKTPHFIVSSEFPLKFVAFNEKEWIIKRSLTCEVEDLKMLIAKEYELQKEEILLFCERKLIDQGQIFRNPELFNIIEENHEGKKFKINEILVDFVHKCEVIFIYNSNKYSYLISSGFSVGKLKKLMDPIVNLNWEDQKWNLIDPEEKPLSDDQILKNLDSSSLIISIFRENREEDEYFANLMEAIKIYPDSFEKELLKFWIYLHKFVKLGSAEISEIEKKALDLQQMAIENTPYDLLNQFKEFFDILQHKEKLAMENKILQIFGCFAPINLELLSLQLKRSEKEVQNIHGGKIFVFFGNTGCGKSTSICYLNGCTMIPGKKSKIEVDPNSTPPAPCKISNSTHSETKGFYPIRVSNIPKGKGIIEDYLMLCDTAGFSDTGGAHIDLLNSISIIKAITKASEVKPVIIVSESSVGCKLEGLISLAKILALMINDRFALKCCDYFFVDFNYNEEQIGNKIGDLIENMTSESKNNKECKQQELILTILTHMRDKMRILQPLAQRPTPNDILAEWSRSDCSFISHPDQYFCNFFSSRTLDQANNQIEQIKKALEFYLIQKNSQMVEFKLNQLRMFHQILGREFISKYDESTKTVAQFLNEVFEVEISIFIQKLCQENELTKDDIVKFFEFSFVKLWNNVKKEHFENLHYMVHSIDTIKGNFLNKLKELAETYEKASFLDYTKLSSLRNIDLILQNFPHLEDIKKIQNKIVDDLSKNLSHQFDNMETLLESNKFEAVLEVLNKYQKYSLIFQEFDDDLFTLSLLKKAVAELYQAVKNRFVDFYKKFEENYFQKINDEWNYLNKSDYEWNFKNIREHLNEVINNIRNLEAVESSIELDALIGLKDIKDVKLKLLKDIDDFLKEIRDFIKQSRVAENYVEISLAFKEIREIMLFSKEIKYSCPLIHNMIKSVIQELKYFMKRLETELTKIIKDMHQKREIIDYKRLDSSLKFISFNEELIYEIVPSAKFTFSIIDEEIKTFFEDKQEEFLCFSSRLEDYPVLHDIQDFLLKLFKVKRHEQISAKVKIYLDKIKKNFIDSIKFNLESITFSLDNDINDILNNPNNLENIINYLNALKKLFFDNRIFVDLFEDLKEIQRIMPIAKFIQEIENLLNIYQTDLIQYTEHKDLGEKDIQAGFQYLETLKKLLSVSNFPVQIEEKYKEKYNNFLSMIKEYRSDLNYEIAAANDVIDLKAFIIKLKYCKKCFRFDRFLEKDNDFLSLYQSNEEKFRELMLNLKQKSDDCLKNHDYEEFKSIFDKINNKDILDQTPHYVKRHLEYLQTSMKSNIKGLLQELETLFQNIKNTKAFMNYKSARDAYDLLRILKSAKQNLIWFSLNLEEEWNKYEHFFLQIFTSEFKQIDLLFSSFQFEAAESRVERLNSILNLRFVLSNENSKQIEEGFNNLSNYRKNSFDKLLMELAESNFDNFEFNPPKDIYENLKKMRRDCNEYYDIFPKYSLALKKKIQERMDQLINNENIDFLKLKMLKNHLTLIPEFIKNMFEDNINQILT